jgi:acyl transferase domain-containing protein
LARRWVRGETVDWAALGGPGRRVLRLPGYPWQRSRHWLGAGGSPVHPLLGRAATPAGRTGVWTWEAELDPDRASLAYLRDHRVHGAAVLPVAAYVEMALAASGEIFGRRPCHLEDLEIERPIVLAPAGTGRVRTVLTQTPGGGAEFQIRGGDRAGEGGWRVHARGRVRVSGGGPDGAGRDGAGHGGGGHDGA